MPVRRWDFRSWARLGRPIVQEFQSPSAQTVTLILDASIGHDKSRSSKPVLNNKETLSGTRHDFEELLRWVATAIDHFHRINITTRIYLSCNPTQSFLQADHQGVVDVPSMLVQLASVEAIDPDESEKRIEEVLADLDPKTVFLFTLRADWQQNEWGRVFDASTKGSTNITSDRITLVNVIQFGAEKMLPEKTFPDKRAFAS